MRDEHEHSHDHEHSHEGHDHGDDHDHDHALIVDRLPAGVWQIDPHGSEVLFKAKAFGFLPVTGIFEDFHGQITVDASGGVTGQLVIQAASVNSGWRRRDANLRSAAYLDVAEHPEVTFTIDAIEPSGSEHQSLGGSLDLRRKSVALSFPVYAIAHGDHLHLEGEVMVDYDLAGLGWSKPPFVGNQLRLEIALTLSRS